MYPLGKLRLLHSSQVGVSLVETLVAIAIIGAGITTLLTALSTGSLAVNRQNEDTVAQRLAQAQIESVKSAPYDVSGVSYSLVAAPAGYSLSLDVDSALYSSNRIQKLTVDIVHDGSPVLTMESYKVDR